MKSSSVWKGRKEGEKTDATSLWGRNDSCPCCKQFFAAVVAVAWPWGAQGGAGGTPVGSGCPSPTQPPGSQEVSPPPGIYKVFVQVISAQTRLQETLLVILPQPRQRAGGLIFDGWFTLNKGPKQHWAPDLGMVTLEPMGSFPISLNQCYFFPSW